MQLELLNQSPKYPPARLVDPPRRGYLHLAAAVAPPSGPPFPRTNARRTEFLGRLKGLADDLEAHDLVERATVYRAIVVPPATGYARQPRYRPARFDVAVLVETTSVDSLDTVEDTDAYQELSTSFAKAGADTHVMRARCAKSTGDVDKSRPGLFLFNHFVAQDPAVALELWDHLAGWYARETGLDNSTLLQPLGDSDYAFVNHARWDVGLPEFLLRQLAKPSFRSYVQTNLLVNRTGAMPVLYRLA
ncbi:hypothetical protein [Kitasatospora herbaricolor]|uniref:Uncharacterized protein n=1 Tax=Kitasatospora herbaricolor TaxID=68217 RepID=A0ABZ1W220_9ACTN|nr:hypothetical protein [Kitasatospora herbaricolor]